MPDDLKLSLVGIDEELRQQVAEGLLNVSNPFNLSKLLDHEELSKTLDPKNALDHCLNVVVSPSIIKYGNASSLLEVLHWGERLKIFNVLLQLFTVLLVVFIKHELGVSFKPLKLRWEGVFLGVLTFAEKYLHLSVNQGVKALLLVLFGFNLAFF